MRLFFLFAGCGGDDPPPPTSSPTADTGSTGGTTPTGDTSVTTIPPGRVAFTEGPAVELPPPMVPLVRKLTACADTADGAGSSLSATVTTEGETFEVRDDEVGACHRMGLFGLRPDRDYCVVFTASAVGEEPAVSEPTCFRTDPLPADFPKMTVRRNRKEQREQGLIWADLGSNPVTGPFYFVALNQDLEVVYLNTRLQASAFEITPDDHIVYENGDIVEVDLFGGEIRRFSNERSVGGGVPVATNPFHHEVNVHPDGTWSSLSTVSIDVTRYPVTYEFPLPFRTAAVRDQTVVRWDATGAIVEEVSLASLLDPRRIGFDSLAQIQGGYEWGHANAASRTPEDDGWLVSLRHQDAVIEVSDEGELRWILGTPKNWPKEFDRFLLTPVGEPFEWQYHQHAPEMDPDRTVRLFDNHNYGASPWQLLERPLEPTETRSRVVQFHVDPVAHTVEQDWEYGDLIDGPVFAYARGDVDKLPNGNVLALFPTIVAEHGEMLIDLGKGGTSARIVELDVSGAVPEPLLDVEFWSEAEDNATGWYIYRVLSGAPPWAD